MSVDPYFDSVAFLLPSDGANGSTAFTDESPTGRLLTAHGSVQVSTADPKFGTGAALFDGVGDFISAPDSSDWSFGTGQFTVEGWFQFAVKTTDQAMIGHWDANDLVPNDAWFLFLESGNLRWRASTGISVIDVDYAWTPTLLQWYYLAVDRDAANKLRVYVDGAMVASMAAYLPGWPDSTGTLHLGVTGDNNPNPSLDFQGQMDDVRITKGVARYASDGGFAVPTEAHPLSGPVAPQTTGAGISFPSYVADATFAMVTGAAHASFPVANLGVLKDIVTPFRASASGAIAFEATLAADQLVEFVALCNHNATDGATYRIRLFSDAAMTALAHDSGTLAFDIPAGSLFRTVTPYRLPSSETVRAVRVELSDIGVAWQIGGLEIAGLWDLSAGLTTHDARSLGIKPHDGNLDVGEGVLHGTRQFSPRVFTLGNSLIDWTDEGVTFLDFQMEKGLSQPFVWVRDYGDTATWPRECALVRNQSLPRLGKRDGMFGSLALDMLEHLA